MNKSHIVSSFDEDLDRVESLVIEMGGLVEHQLLNATEALIKQDPKLAKKVVKSDKQVMKLEGQVNHLTLEVLATRQPLANDLRTVISTLKIASHLQRLGEYTRNMATRTRAISKAAAFSGSTGTLRRMSQKVQGMIKDILDAFSARDRNLAEQVREMDEEVDLLHNTLFRELLTYMMEDPRHISGCMHVLFIAKNIERMGDHVAEIAQEIMFLVDGEWPETKRPKVDVTSSLILDPDDLNALDDEEE